MKHLVLAVIGCLMFVDNKCIDWSGPGSAPSHIVCVTGWTTDAVTGKIVCRDRKAR